MEYQNTTTICEVKVMLNYYCGKGGKQRIFREEFDILCDVSELNADRVYYIFYLDFRGLFQILSGLIRKIMSFILCN